MSRINKHNYESYLIDWMEGTLDARTTHEVMAFLDANPDIRKEAEGFEEVVLEPEPVFYKDKSAIKKTKILAYGAITPKNYETFFIAFYENDLTEDEKTELKNFLKINTGLQKEFDFFGRLYLTDDEVVSCPQKELLYGKRKIIPLFWTASAAAVIILLIAVFGILKSSINPDTLPQKVNTFAQRTAATNKNASSHTTTNHNTVQITVKKAADKGLSKTVGVHPKKTVAAKKTQQTVKKERNIVLIAALHPVNSNIKLTDDEVYCRFKYKKNLTTAQVLPVKKSRSFAGKIVAALFNDVKKKAAGVMPKDTESNEPLLAKVFDGGAHLLNNYTGTQATVTKYYDGRGNLVAYHFSGGQINFSKKFTVPGQ